MAMMSKIIEVPIADKNNAEKVVNEQLAAIGGTITSIQSLDERRVIVFYNGDGSTPGTGGGSEDPGTGEGGGEDPGDDPGTGGGSEDPGTGGGGSEDPGTGGGSEDTEEYDYPVVPLEEDPYEGKFGEYAFAVRVDWPAAVSTRGLAEFGELGALIQTECDALYDEDPEGKYADWVGPGTPYELYAWQVTADVGKYDTDKYDALIALSGSNQVSTAHNSFNMAAGTHEWIFNHNLSLEDSTVQLTSTFGTPTSVVMIRRAVKKS